MILDILNSNDDFAAKIFDSLFYSLQIVFAKKPPQLFQLLPETLPFISVTVKRRNVYFGKV